MQKSNAHAAHITGRCWEVPPTPRAEFLEKIKSGSLAAARVAGPDKMAEAIAILRREKHAKPLIFLGAGTCGLGAGAGHTRDAIGNYLSEHGVDAELIEVGCIGLCSEEPIMDVTLPGKARLSFGNVTAEMVPVVLDGVFSLNPPADMVFGQFRDTSVELWKDVPFLDEHPFFIHQRRVVLAASGILDPGNIDEYIARGGYSALAQALNYQTPDELCTIVESSGLRGRGGGGFPTGKKWKLARQTPADQKYLICNADEGDPGAFMDRAVGESDPHRLLEGIAIASYAIGATKAYIYIRAEYPLAVKRLTAAIAQARQYGLLGRNILDSGIDLEVKIKMGAGAFVCGEETALIHSIEGKRGMPRPRPPFPSTKGLFGKPTVINNVETLANLPMILDKGAEWFAAMGTVGSKGTKVFALSGMVKRTGLVEIPMGTTLRQVVFDAGGGIANNKRCKAVQIGGPSGGCIPEAHLDIPCDYEALKNFGAIMGSGGLVVVDENTCMVDLAKFFMEFIQNESCGKCIPCREGTRRMLEILQAITRPRHLEDDLDALLRFQGIMYLKKLSETIKATSLCGLGQTAPNPVLSTLKWFRDEYEAHVFNRECPAGACKELVGASCENSCPVGTEVWRYIAHTARGEFEDAYRIIRSANPLPSVCARVCHHPCEEMCRAGVTGGEPIAIRTLKRFIVDHVDPDVYQPVPGNAGGRAARIAVIGAGPTGLAAAHTLSLIGHKVTVFEKEGVPGGMLVSAIPAYRLPREPLQKEISRLMNPNLEIKYNTVLGRDITVEGLLNDGHQAVYLALGSHRSKKLNVPGEDAAASSGVKGIVHGITFLKAFNIENKTLARGNVGVIGGGNSAIDAARVAWRQPGVEHVTVFYRRSRNEMPAYVEEIEAALAEGVAIEELVAPVEVLSENGRLISARFIRNRLTEPDTSGRRKPVPVPGTEFTVAFDTLIVAISEQPDTDGLNGIELTRWGTVAVNPESGLTNYPGVFAGGDVVTGPNTVIAALAAGKQAALMIDQYVSGKLLKQFKKVKLPTVYVEPPLMAEEEGAAIARIESPHIPVVDRRHSFAEVELCISREDAICEARRCLRCDLEFTQPV